MSLPIEQITKGPGYHWFGYYDKLQSDPSGRRLLGMEVGFEHRLPTADDTIEVGLIDRDDGNRWIELGSSKSWCWQQGCMLQWIPRSSNTVIWNDREGDKFVCRKLNVDTGQSVTIPHAIYTLSPDGRYGFATDFRRINDMRPCCGYAGLPDSNCAKQAPDDSGIWRIDMETGESKLIVSIAEVFAMPPQEELCMKAKHYFNHLLVNPSGERIEFLHRCRGEGFEGFKTRMLTASIDGGDIRVVDPHGGTSHFIWKDNEHILAWSWHPDMGSCFLLYTDLNNVEPDQIGKGIMTENGHCTYLPGNKWILNDTYPSTDERLQCLYVYNAEDNRKVSVGDFYAPKLYQGEWRCDLHPRSTPDGKEVIIDSAHGGDGRQMYVVDIGGLVGE
jgi:hypothetical protein